MTRTRLTLLYGIFFVSGFCGLIYESIWSHYLKLILGHAAHAQALVLIVFVGGLALGAWLAGNVSSRLRNPILVYAAVEILVALVAFSFHRVFVGASNWVLDWLLPTVCAQEGLCWANWAVAAGLILLPSILLGATFPLMSAGILRAGVSPGRGLSLLYFLNSAGAALGVLLCGFVLIPRLGLPGTLLVAGVLNALVALGAYAAVRNAPESAVPAPQPVDAAPGAGGTRLLLWIAALTGLSSFIYEVVWIRMLTQVLGAATHAFELMLASFIFGLALGGFWVRNRIDRAGSPEALLAKVQILMGVLAVATLPLYLGSFEGMSLALNTLVRSADGYTVFNAVSAAMAMAVILPATICAGMTLPVITAALLRRGHGEGQIGRVYAANTFGAIVGVLLAVYLLMPALGLKWALATGALIDVALGGLIIWKLRPAARLRWGGALAGAMALLVLVPAIARFDPVRISSGVYRSGVSKLDADTQVLFNEDGRTATISVSRDGDGVVTLRTNGKPDGASLPGKPGKLSDDDPTVVMLGLLGPAHHPGAKHAAVVGLGTGITSAALLASNRIESVETIEIEPKVLQAAQLYRPTNTEVFDDPRSRIVIDDARAHFSRSARRYDLIVSEPSNPWVSGVAGLFTTEFYRRAAAQLAPGGHFVQWLQLYEASPEMVASIIGAFAEHFPEFRIYGTNRFDVILVGRGDGGPVALQPAVFDMPRARERLASIGIEGPDILAAHDLGPGGAIKLLYGGYGAPPNSDYHPYVDNRAAKDRFMRLNATSLQWLRVAPIPFLEFGTAGAPWLGKVHSARPHMPTHIISAAAAGHAERYLRGLPVPPVGLAAIEGSLKDYALARSWLVDCKPSDGVGVLWDAVLLAAVETIPAMPTDGATALWKGFLNGPCRSRFNAAQIEWLELFAAVAARDARATQPAADAVLRRRAALTTGQREYALLAGLAARTSLGRYDEALALVAEHGKGMAADRLNLPWFRYQRLLLDAPRVRPTPAVPAG